MADLATRSLSIGYAGGSAILLTAVIAVLLLWQASEKSISVDTVNTPRVEVFYWAVITISQTLGAALGDWLADDAGICFLGGAGIFAAALAIVAVLYFRTTLRARLCSGPPSSLRARPAPRLATFSKSPSHKTGWRGAVRSPGGSRSAHPRGHPVHATKGRRTSGHGSVKAAYASAFFELAPRTRVSSRWRSVPCVRTIRLSFSAHRFGISGSARLLASPPVFRP